jgi:CheY-like chemotaxis protein
VVDDEEPIRSFAKEVLETHGYRVLAASDGSEAVEIFRDKNGEIGLVILDMMMPKMGGKEAFLRLTELNPDVRALLSTGYSQKGKAQDILNSGVKGFIQKPYQVNVLLSKVRSVLDDEIRN